MCGLAGIFCYSSDASIVETDELLRMRQQMNSRGPDGAGLWVSDDRRVGLAHRRLAIIDLSDDGAQPMASGNGRYRIVFNGEIYNFGELRVRLEGQGVEFRSHSDTEVLLELYARYGEEMCRELRGMYAFAIWDEREQTIFLARDPFGIKPLYLHDDGRALRFASQVKALLAGGAIAKKTEPAGIVGYWIWGHVPEPWTTYEGVLSFAPGTWLKVGRGGRSSRGVFQSVENLLSDAERTRRCGSSAVPRLQPLEAQVSLREALLDTVRHHLIADVPVGVFLSAGIDSCTLAALASECGTVLRTVTLGFAEYRGTAADETVLAEQVARQYGAQHQTIWVERSDFEGAIDDFLDAMDQPSVDGLNTWLVSRAAARIGLKVAISGLGGDEFFGGYPSFRQVPMLRHFARPFAAISGLGRLARQVSAPMLRRLTSEKYAGLLEYGATWEGAYMLRRATRMPWELDLANDLEQFFCGLERLSYGQRSDAELERLGNPHAIVSYLETTRYMRGQLLRDSDWAGMAHSLEIRVPLVDARLVEHIAAHNARGSDYSKADLAGAARPPLPRELVRRQKTGFTVPVRDWIERPGKPVERGQRAWQRTVAAAFI